MQNRSDVSGIVGLVHGWMAARNGNQVVVLERDQQVVGASIRNFGMIWSIGQPADAMQPIALTSRILRCELVEF